MSLPGRRYYLTVRCLKATRCQQGLGASVALLGLLLTAAPALADVRRFAFLVGSNKGGPHEAPLRYAESDVSAFADTLTRMGGFPSERVVRLTAPTADRVRRALVNLNLRIQDEVRGGDEAVLFVYYSGHSDAQSLHIGGTELSAEELSGLVRLSPAKLKILLVDACRSGALTRVKGGTQVAPFQIGLQDQLRNEGYAIITSSAAGEDAQESDSLRSSVFTHHFLAALRGLGDSNSDRLVTLGEAYGYANEQALRASIATVVGTQHATFDYDLRGRADPVLTDLRSTGDLARLVLGTPGDYLLTSVDGDAVLIEASVKQPRTPVVVPAGRFNVRLRTRTNVYQTEVSLRAGEAVSVAQDTMSPVPLAQVVRKGETQVRLASGPTVAGSLHGPLARNFSTMAGAQASWAFELPHITLLPRVGFASGRVTDLAARPTVKSHTLDEVNLELSALYVFDIGRISLAPMVSVGSGFFSQVVEQQTCEPTGRCTTRARPVGLITTVGAWGSWPLGRGFTVEATAEIANYFLRRQKETQDLATDAERLGALTWRGGLGLGYRY